VVVGIGSKKAEDLVQPNDLARIGQRAPRQYLEECALLRRGARSVRVFQALETAKKRRWGRWLGAAGQSYIPQAGASSASDRARRPSVRMEGP
jgi:hypothetical protein